MYGLTQLMSDYNITNLRASLHHNLESYIVYWFLKIRLCLLIDSLVYKMPEHIEECQKEKCKYKFRQVMCWTISDRLLLDECFSKLAKCVSGLCAKLN